MSWYRWLSCAVLLVVVDGAWLYLLFGLLGFMAGIGHAPLSLLVVISVLSLSVLMNAMGELIPERWPLRRWFVRVAACVIGWLAIADSLLHSMAGFINASAFATNATTASKLGVDWPLEVLTGRVSSAQLVAVVIAALAVIALWQLGARRVRVQAGTQVIARSFRIGLLVFMLLLVFEAAGGLQLGTRAAMAPFFAASLAGMALARAPAHGVTLTVWLGLSIAAVAAVAGLGLAFALLGVVVLRGGFSALREVWLDFAYAVDRSVSETLAQFLGTSEAGAGVNSIDIQGIADEPSQKLMLLVVSLGAVVFALLLHRLLTAPPIHKLPGVVMDLGQAEHEFIVDSGSEPISQSMQRLLPRWMWRRSVEALAPALPEHPTLAQIYSLYYQMLDRARAQGIELDRADTPRERSASLARAFPDLPVERLSSMFEAACYGRVVPAQIELDHLAEQLRRQAGRQ